jgi:hypothetical protein
MSFLLHALDEHSQVVVVTIEFMIHLDASRCCHKLPHQE